MPSLARGARERKGRVVSPEMIDATAREVAGGASRRAALGALFAAALAAVLAEKSEAKRKRRSATDRRNRKNRDSARAKEERKNRKRKKNKKGKGCKSNHSEKEILRYIAKAAKKYGQSKSAMERVARCESGLDPCAYSKAGPYYGLYQFLKSTWKTTPYKSRSIYDPKAQALATAWMWKKGRKNEWACK